jgi:hypothetical protein
VSDEKTGKTPASPVEKAPAEKTVRATTPGFSGLAASEATAQCPAGYTCTRGGVTKGHPDQTITTSQKAADGTGYTGGITGGPNGGTAVVHADCVRDDGDGD